MEPLAVWIGGILHVENGKLLSPAGPGLAQPPEALKDKVTGTMNLGRIDPAKLVPSRKTGGNEAAVNTLVFEGLFTKPGQETLPLLDGRLDISKRDDLCFIAVCDRYGLQTITLGILQGFGLRCGAVATTVSHDSHNLTLIYKDPVTAASIGNLLIEAGGGIAASDGKETCIVELPICGIISTVSAKELAPQIHALEAGLPKLFGGEPASLLKMATLALPVIPEIRVTNRGIVNTVTQEFIPLFAGV
jgi:adenine deaminase